MANFIDRVIESPSAPKQTNCLWIDSDGRLNYYTEKNWKPVVIESEHLEELVGKVENTSSKVEDLLKYANTTLDKFPLSYSDVVNGVYMNTSEALGDYSMALGNNNISEGNYSFVGGKDSKATKLFNFAYGNNVITNYANEVSFGYFNKSNNDTLFSIGNGASNTRKNAFEVKKNGNVYIENITVPLQEALNTLSENLYKATGSITSLDEKLNNKDLDIESLRRELSATSNTLKVLNTSITDIETGVTKSIEELNKALDKKVSSWFYEGTPTNNNYPASEWISVAEKESHIGDTYTNIQNYVDDLTTPTAGKSYRWQPKDEDNNDYHWHLIADSDSTKALLEASKALGAADGKSTIFLEKPTNYSIGDFWVLEEDNIHPAGKKGFILQALNSRGYYVESDWAKQVSYTDDTRAEEINLDVIDARERLLVAEESLNTTKEELNEAKAEAEAANKLYVDILEDSKISRYEIPHIREELNNIVEDYNDILVQSVNYKIDETNETWQNFSNIYTDYKAILEHIISVFEDPNTFDIDIPNNLKSLYTNYYINRISILDNLFKMAKEEVENAQITANQAITDLISLNTSVNALDTKVEGLERLGDSIEEINNRLDGVVTQYTGKYKPGFDNEPFLSWDQEDKNNPLLNHVGDIFINVNDPTDELYGDIAGKSWRWIATTNASDVEGKDYIMRVYTVDYVDTVYYFYWQEIIDSDATKALAEASKAKALADGKRRVFINEPYPPYDEGDLWANGTDLHMCFRSKENGIFNFDDWQLATNYTSDKKAIEVLNQLNTTTENLNLSIANAEQAAKDYTDEGKKALQDAIDILNTTKAGIDEVYTKALVDGKISESEQKAITAAENYANTAQALAEQTAAAYADGKVSEKEKEILNKASSDLAKAKSELNDAIDIVDQEAKTAQETADTANTNAINAQTTANSALEAADEAKQSISDIEHLSNTFDTALDVEGVVMSKMVAVKNDDDEVEAFLNGSDFAEDSKHGKLILASGIPQQTESGSPELVDRARESTTRIYEDGELVSKNVTIEGGDLEANYAKFGDMWIFADKDQYTEGKLDAHMIAIQNQHGFENQSDYLVIEGTSTGGNSPGIYMSDYSGANTLNISLKDSFSSRQYTIYDKTWKAVKKIKHGGGFGLNIKSNKNEPLITLSGSRSGLPSLRVASGMFEGLRPNIREIKTTGNASNPHVITELDHTIIINEWNNQRVYLKAPDNPQEGQRYEIYTTAAGTSVSIAVGGGTFNLITGEDWYSPLVIARNRRVHIELFFSRIWWLSYRDLY